MGIEWKDDFAIDDVPVWKCLLKGDVKCIYARLVKKKKKRNKERKKERKKSDRSKCLD